MQEPDEETPPSSPPAEQAAGRDPLAFEETYLRFAPLLRMIAVRKFHIPRADAEILVHDIFVTYLTGTDAVCNLEAYLIAAICNASRHYLYGDASDAPFCGETPCLATPDDELLREVERKQRIARALAGLEPPARDLLYRYYMRGETAQAIAGTLESTPGAVLLSLHQCRRRVQAEADRLAADW